MNNFNILGVHGKIRVLRGGFTKSQFIGEDCLQTEGLGQFADLRGGGGLGKKEGGLIPQSTLCYKRAFLLHACLCLSAYI